MARLFIKDLKIGMTIDGEVFLLAESSLGETRTGPPYLRATLSDKTGRIEARYWDVPRDVMADLKIGAGVRIAVNAGSTVPDEVFAGILTPQEWKQLEDYPANAPERIEALIGFVEKRAPLDQDLKRQIKRMYEING